MVVFHPPLELLPTDTPTRLIQWSPPTLHDFCLNVDGGVSPSTGIAYIAYLLRDNRGNWVMGFKKTVGFVQPLCAELWALHTSLQFALQIQSNGMEALKLIQVPLASSSSIPLVRSISNMIGKHWLISFNWVLRDANKPTDMLAKLADHSQIAIAVLHIAPTVMLPLLKRGILGPPYLKSKH
ncbi:uncharacterized protein LOC120116867 [Hibiscus syriacus]|uniref:uncharacterized protein LOC120116867 n=1 Tax=Hibiscus syriacus TaxID=106335 RepID=UPI00192150FB|nr:uncharacterized protein LOC120116867 [Hibiscus syriacus]